MRADRLAVPLQLELDNAALLSIVELVVSIWLGILSTENALSQIALAVSRSYFALVHKDPLVGGNER